VLGRTFNSNISESEKLNTSREQGNSPQIAVNAFKVLWTNVYRANIFRENAIEPSRCMHTVEKVY
jgi:hypothetical protein